MSLPRPTAPDPTGTKSEMLANFLFEQLVGVDNAALPTANLTDSKYEVPWDENSEVFKPVQKVTIDELVAEFHALMGGVGVQITKEYEAGRITGAKYADVYLALMQSALQAAVQFALGKDQAFWMAAKTQADAITAQMQNELAKIQAVLGRANYALTKLKLATEDSQFGQSEYQRTYILPMQKAMVEEQANSQRAQTLDTRLDNTSRLVDENDPSKGLKGVLGVQKSLYNQQITSYQDDTKIKATRVFSDLWTTMKTVDDATETSKYFDGVQGTEYAMDSVFKKARWLAMGETDNFTPT